MTPRVFESQRWWRLVGILGVTCIGCRQPQSSPTPVETFDALWRNTHHSWLVSQSESIGTPLGLAEEESKIRVADGDQSDIKVFSMSGRLLKIVGGAGDDPGRFRIPMAIGDVGGSGYLVLDAGRQIIARFDSHDQLQGEFRVSGSWNGLAVFPGDSQIVLAGTVSDPSSDQVRMRLHAFDLSGRPEGSFREAIRARRKWEATFGTVFVSAVGRLVVSGTYNTNVIQLYDRVARRTRNVTVAPEWYRPIAWPDDDDNSATETKVQQINAWVRKQCLLSAVFGLGDEHVLVRFNAFDPSGGHEYFYAVVDTAGQTIAVAGPTSAQVLSTDADTAFWVARRSRDTLSFGYGIAALTQPSGAVLGGARAAR